MMVYHESQSLKVVGHNAPGIIPPVRMPTDIMPPVTMPPSINNDTDKMPPCHFASYLALRIRRHFTPFLLKNKNTCNMTPKSHTEANTENITYNPQ